MSIDTKDWKEFKLIDFFDMRAGTYYNKLEYNKGTTPYVSASDCNNGILDYIDMPAKFKGNCLTIGKVGCACFYQEFDFCATADVTVLIPKISFNKHIAMFFVSVITLEQAKWSYGRQIRLGDCKELVVKLPEFGQKPDFNYMESYIKSLNHKVIKTKVCSTENVILAREWQEFKLNDIFNFKKGKRLTKADMINGEINYLGAISENNGVRQKIEAEESQVNKANCITINYNGSVGEAFYQSEPFWASDDVNILYAKNWAMNKYNAMFIITVIKANKYRFSYGRKWTLEKMKDSIIKLPTVQPNVPDYDYMERYIKSLPYSDRI